MEETPRSVPVSPELHRLTAPATLNLATARTLARGLEMLGIAWSPIPYEEVQITGPGLYAWAAGMLPDDIALVDRPVLYVGISNRKAGGLRRRLTDETILIGESAGHVHGRAMHRLGGKALGAPVYRLPGADGVERLKEIIGKQDIKFAREFADRGAAKLNDWLAAPNPSLLRKAEELCIRIAVHTGDTAPPINSHYATAWGTDRASDWGGWAVAQCL